MTDKTRADFEAVMRAATPSHADEAMFARDADGEYVLPTVYATFFGWQAATEQGKRQPLTDDRIGDMADNYNTGRAQGDYDFARAIEAAHGITATPKGNQPADLQDKYNELLYAVGMKWPDETRHETALRYIRKAEAPGTNSQPATPQGKI